MAELIADPFRAARLLLTLRRAGVTNPDVLAVMEKIPRDMFAGEEFADIAFEDCILPIACGQIIPKLSVVGYLLQRLELGAKAEKRVLLVGSGSGYVASLLASLAQDVFAIERYQRLHDSATETLAGLEIPNVHNRHADGLPGWPERGPFDRILLMGAVRRVPDTLLEQLAKDGFLIAPVENDAAQEIILYRGGDEAGHSLGPSAFTPLIEGETKAL